MALQASECDFILQAAKVLCPNAARSHESFSTLRLHVKQETRQCFRGSLPAHMRGGGTPDKSYESVAYPPAASSAWCV